MLLALTWIHVALSLVGLAAGCWFAAGLLGSRDNRAWTDTFLYSTIATSVTGFFFPFERLLPAHVIGVLSLAALTAAVWARGRYLASGASRKAYIVTSLVAFYLNAFVLVVQAFLKVDALRALAPTQSELPFALVQGLVSGVFVWLGWRAVQRFHPRLGKPLAAAAGA